MSQVDAECERVLYRVPNLEVAQECFRRYSGLEEGIPPPRPAFGGLGLHKPLHKLVGSGHVWRNALTVLSAAEEVYVIGWSCSPYDTMARFYFGSELHERKTPPKRKLVIDPNAAALAPNFRPLFGNGIEFIEAKVEEVDWGRVLG